MHTFCRKLRNCFILTQLLCLLCVGSLYAQKYMPLPTTRQGGTADPFLSRRSAEVAPARFYTVKSDFSFTSLALRISKDDLFAGAYLIAAQDTIYLQADIHQREEDNLRSSVLLVFDQPQHSFSFYSAGISGKVYFSLINAEPGSTAARQAVAAYRKARAAEEVCTQPELVPQAVWRSGLPGPSYNRVETQVRHVIVHHSAGSNSNTDHLATVRNIYIFHTRDRGWSDIGYNFLVARDGTIFQGRSFGDQNTDSGSIRGAHFCGNNSGTMGICMLGNFNTAQPSDTAMSSLRQLTAWKLHKESLDPLETYAHPANSSLGVIAAHRNGCATECPGANLYARLDELRLEVAAYLEEECGAAEEEDPLADVFRVYPVPMEGEGSLSLPEGQELQELRLLDMKGQEWMLSAYQDGEVWKFDTHGLTAGVYILKITGTDFQEERKLLIH
jgi:hypothetical protein